MRDYHREIAALGEEPNSLGEEQLEAVGCLLDTFGITLVKVIEFFVNVTAPRRVTDDGVEAAVWAFEDMWEFCVPVEGVDFFVEVIVRGSSFVVRGS